MTGCPLGEAGALWHPAAHPAGPGVRDADAGGGARAGGALEPRKPRQQGSDGE